MISLGEHVFLFYRSYIALPTFVLFWSGYKIWYKTSLIPLDKVDLISGKREIDEEENKFLAEQEMLGPQSRWRKIFDSL